MLKWLLTIAIIVIVLGLLMPGLRQRRRPALQILTERGKFFRAVTRTQPEHETSATDPVQAQRRLRHLQRLPQRQHNGCAADHIPHDHIGH